MRRAAVLCALALAGCGGGGEKPSGPPPQTAAKLTLTSPAFKDGGTLPARFTCSGAGDAPSLRWSGVPKDARELTLVVEDPDAGNFVHWIVLAIPPTAHSAGAGIDIDSTFGRPGYGAPCPPTGDAPHRYVFSLYATRAPLGLSDRATPDQVHAKLAELAIARGVLTARYGR